MKKKISVIWVFVLSIIIVMEGVFIGSLLFRNNIIEKEDNGEEVQNTVENTDEPQNEVPVIGETEQEVEPMMEIKYTKGVFSWEPGMINSENREEMYEVIRQLNIDEVYQYFETGSTDDENAYMLADELYKMDVDLYILAGESDWTYRADGKPMLDEISRAIEYRDYWGADKLTGIVFDIEPYDSAKWERGKQDVLLQNFLDGMEIAYNAAKEANLRIILCIPAWYDDHYEEFLIKLLEFCDVAAVMNYDRANEYDNIINEINYSRELSKEIICIFEFQEVGKYNLTDMQTYNNEGLEAAIESFETLYRKAGYENLNFGYHYLRPLQEMLAEE